MVIETYRLENIDAVGERYRRCGRMLPAGVTYVQSWIEKTGLGCFQLMEAASIQAPQPWTSAWADLVEFEIKEVSPSAEFWDSRHS